MQEYKKEDILYENGRYKVVIGPSRILEEAIVYLVINKETDVIEAEDSMLPRVYDYADQLERGMGDILKAKAEKVSSIEGAVH